MPCRLLVPGAWRLACSPFDAPDAGRFGGLSPALLTAQVRWAGQYTESGEQGEVMGSSGSPRKLHRPLVRHRLAMTLADYHGVGPVPEG